MYIFFINFPHPNTLRTVSKPNTSKVRFSCNFFAKRSQIFQKKNFLLPSLSFSSFSWSQEHFFLPVGQNNFGNKIPFFSLVTFINNIFLNLVSRWNGQVFFQKVWLAFSLEFQKFFSVTSTYIFFSQYSVGHNNFVTKSHSLDLVTIINNI